MNTHKRDFMINKEKPVGNHASFHNLNFDSCYTTKTIKSLS